MRHHLDQDVLVRFRVVSHHVHEQFLGGEVDDMAQTRWHVRFLEYRFRHFDDIFQFIKVTFEFTLHMFVLGGLVPANAAPLPVLCHPPVAHSGQNPPRLLSGIRSIQPSAGRDWRV